ANRTAEQLGLHVVEPSLRARQEQMTPDSDPSLGRWFVSTDWLSRHLDDPRVVVVDGSWHLGITGRNARKEYEAAHVPGAVFFDIDAIADLTNPLPHMLPTPDNFAAAAAGLGIDEAQEIVVYDAV